MILVDIEVPVMGQTYDFQVDEYITLGAVIVEMKDMICTKEQCLSIGSEEELTLWDMERRVRLPLNRTAKECGLLTGAHLILV